MRRRDSICVVTLLQVALAGADAPDCQEQWDPSFGQPGFSELVVTLRALDLNDGQGELLYAMGYFEAAYGVPAKRFAIWNGQEWTQRSGLNSSDIYDIVALPGDGPSKLVVAGYASNSGVWWWTGQFWDYLGNGLESSAYDLEFFDDGNGPRLFACGSFLKTKKTPQVTVNHFAVWDGMKWGPVFPDGLNGNALSMAVYDDGRGEALYIAGAFSLAGGQPANKFVRWDGRTLTALPGPVDGSIRRLLAVDGSGAIPKGLYAGGSFTSMGVEGTRTVARWTGRAWEPLGTGLFKWDDDAAANLDVLHLHDDGSAFGPALIVGGHFQGAEGVASPNLIRWNGVEWGPMDQGIDGTIRSAASYASAPDRAPDLFLCGSFMSVDSQVSRFVARWKSIQPEAPHAEVASIQLSAPYVNLVEGETRSMQATGLTESQEPAPVTCEADWTILDPQIAQFTEPGTLRGISEGETLAIVELGDAMTTFPVSVSVADTLCEPRWDTTLGNPGFNDNVRCVAVAPDPQNGGAMTIFAGGNFTKSGTKSMFYIAKWNGTAWVDVSGGVSGGGGWVTGITSFGPPGASTLVVVGSFTKAGVANAKNVAKMTGQFWTVMGAGLDGTILTAAAFDDGSGLGSTVYVGGSVTGSGGTPIQRVARWTGSAWEQVGPQGLPDTVQDLRVWDGGDGPTLYAATDDQVFRWSGSNWIAVSPLLDTNGSIDRIAFMNLGDGAKPYAVGSIKDYNGEVLCGLGSFTAQSWAPAGNSSFPSLLDLSAGDPQALGFDAFVSGTFTYCAASSVRYIAGWREGRWHALAGGPDSYVEDMEMALDPATQEPILIAAGGFASVDGKPAANIAVWRRPCLNVDGDLNSDGAVDAADLGLLLAAWGTTDATADVNGDGTVDEEDLCGLLANWT